MKIVVNDLKGGIRSTRNNNLVGVVLKPLFYKRVKK